VRETDSQYVSAVLGANEKRTEPYMKYGEGASQFATTHSATSCGKVLALPGIGRNGTG